MNSRIEQIIHIEGQSQDSRCRKRSVFTSGQEGEPRVHELEVEVPPRSQGEAGCARGHCGCVNVSVEMWVGCAYSCP